MGMPQKSNAANNWLKTEAPMKEGITARMTTVHMEMVVRNTTCSWLQHFFSSQLAIWFPVSPKGRDRIWWFKLGCPDVWCTEREWEKLLLLSLVGKWMWREAPGRITCSIFRLWQLRTPKFVCLPGSLPNAQKALHSQWIFLFLPFLIFIKKINSYKNNLRIIGIAIEKIF